MACAKRVALTLCFLLAACATPDSASVRTIQVVPTGALDADLKRLDELVRRHEFLSVPTNRDRVETGAGPVDVLQSYAFRDRRALRLTIGWELRHSRYRIFMTDLTRGGPPARGLECRAYLAIFAEVSQTFGPARIAPTTPERCDPLADGQ